MNDNAKYEIPADRLRFTVWALEELAVRLAEEAAKPGMCDEFVADRLKKLEEVEETADFYRAREAGTA